MAALPAVPLMGETLTVTVITAITAMTFGVLIANRSQ